MESKCLKTQVYMNETIYNENGEIPIDVDFSLPDYCPNIVRILKCKAVSRISSKGTVGKNITVDGAVTINLIYIDDAGKLNSFEYMYPFNKTFETSCELDKVNLYVKSKCEYINCRAITSRKVDIHGAAGIYVKVTRRKCTNIISDYDDSNVELNRGTAPATSPMGNCEKYILIEEEIELGATQQSVRSIIRYDAVPSVKECKILAGKAVVKGEINVTVLSCLDDGSLQTIRSVIPFSQILEVENINDSCESEATAQTAFLEIKPRVNSTGETKSFQINCKLLVSCETYCNNDIDVILDAYSRKFTANIEKSDVCFNKIYKNISESFTAKCNHEFPDGAISSVTDMWCDVKTDNVNCSGNKLEITGIITAYIIACDSDNQIAFYEKQSDFRYNCEFDREIKGMFCEPQITVSSCNYTITGACNIEIRTELFINAAVYECVNIPLITGVTVDENKKIEKTDRGALTIYFADIGESVWDIARRYCSSVEEIKVINDITEDVLQSEKMILVPMC